MSEEIEMDGKRPDHSWTAEEPELTPAQIKALDRQKTIESIDFYQRTDRSGKYALGYASDYMKAKEAARASIKKDFYSNDLNAFDRFEQARASKDIDGVRRAEKHEKANLMHYRREEDAAELENAQVDLLDDVTGYVGAEADGSMNIVAVSSDQLNAAREEVEKAKGDLAEAERVLDEESKSQNGATKDTILEVEALKATLEEKMKVLSSAGLQHAAAIEAQDHTIKKSFAASHAKIEEKTKGWFERRYKEYLSYGHGEEYAYAMAAREASTLAENAIKGLIANGNREAADAILDIASTEKPKKNEETGEFEWDRGKRFYMGAENIRTLKDAIVVQRKKELVDLDEIRKRTALQYAPAVEDMEYKVQTQNVSDDEIRAFCEGLDAKGYPDHSGVYAKLTQFRKRREVTTLGVEVDSFSLRVQTDPKVTKDEIQEFCTMMKLKGYEDSAGLYKSLMDSHKLTEKDEASVDASAYTQKIINHLEDCRRNVSLLVTDAASAGDDSTSSEMYLKAQEGMAWLEEAIVNCVIKEAQASQYRNIFAPQIVKYRKDTLSRTFRDLGIKWDDGVSGANKVKKKHIHDDSEDEYDEEDYAKLVDVFFDITSSGDTKLLNTQYDKERGGYFVPVKKDDDEYVGFYLTRDEMNDLLQKADALVQAYHGGSLGDSKDAPRQVSPADAIKSVLHDYKKKEDWIEKRSKIINSMRDALSDGTIISSSSRLRATVGKEMEKSSKKESK